ncbi:MAG: hypothetical protein Q7V63_09830 [Gammaproteobacteria bacterium]|nr:hypothetical protein [Gammaproteobacteria bacterium]
MTEYVLVPMVLDALVLDEASSVETSFLRYQMQYSNLRNYKSADPKPFSGDSTTQPDAGIYLSWTLPKALRSSVSTQNGNQEVSDNFPFAPNRFLVARVRAGVSADTAITAWVLQSDYLDGTSEDKAKGSSPFVHPFINPDGIPQATLIGRAIPFNPAVTSLPPADQPFLTASGPGNSLFSVFSPGANNVFAFYDPLTGIDSAEFSYYVIGWYANPADDPLQNSKWVENDNQEEAGSFINDLFDWIVYSDTDSIPKNMLVHALLSGITWDKNTTSPSPKAYPKDIGADVKVGFGNTSTEALGAINALNPNAQTEADFLSAFQYNMLDKLDQAASPMQLSIEMRQQWYGASSGGTLWRILPVEPTQSTALPAPPPKEIDPIQKKAVDDLNILQRECDRQQRILQSMQYTLYTLWWKYKWQSKNPYQVPVSQDFASKWLAPQLKYQVEGGPTSTSNPNCPECKDCSGWYIDCVKSQQQRVKDLEAQAKAASDALSASLDPTMQYLQANSMPQYYYANDPVLVVTGLNRSTNYDPTGNILCRLTSQTVNSLTVNGVDYGIDANCQNNIASAIPVLSDPYNLLPNGVQALNIEDFFLSPALFAQDILLDVNQAVQVENAILQLPSPAAGNHFPPSDYARRLWEQPWVPLVLDWQVTVFSEPAYQCDTQDTATFNQSLWKFDGNDYLWQGSTTETTEDFNEEYSYQMELMGRTFVGPYVATNTANQVKTLNQALFQAQPNSEYTGEDLAQNVNDIQNQDILSQRLSGLMAQMVQRNYDSNVAPSGEIQAVLGDSYQGYSNPYNQKTAEGDPTVWDFAPMRGTFFAINQLTVIDSFGRTVDLMQGNYSGDPHTDPLQTDSYFYPIADDELKASTTVEPEAPKTEQSKSTTERMLKLTPRFIQDAQLSFNLTANDASNQDVEISATNPVCGWIIPNHLNRSLAVYDNKGRAWGELYLSLHANHVYEPIWQPSPMPLSDTEKAPATLDEIPNIYVKALLQGITKHTDSGQCFNDFIQAIDETLWTVDTEGKRNDALLDVLIGRPLAIVRASLALKLKGLAYANQDWWNIFAVDMNHPPASNQPAKLKNVTGGVFDNDWSVRLGDQSLSDDGLIGYYLDDPTAPDQSFYHFNCTHLPDTAKGDYLKPIGPDNYITLKFTDDSTVDLDEAKKQISRVTMLIDPRGSCHASTGILPVYAKLIPDDYLKPALNTLCYFFRSGPIVTPLDRVSMPQPAENQGKWEWYDTAIKKMVPLDPKATEVRFMSPPPLAKQGWLKFTPNVDDSKTKEKS